MNIDTAAEALDSLSDAELIDNLLSKKDDIYFAILYDRYITVTYRKCLSYLENEDDAQDVVQKVWIAVYFALPDFRREAKFSTWLFRITVNHCLNFLKAKKKLVPLESIAEVSVSSETARSDAKIDVTNLFNTLSHSERVLLHLKYVEELTYDEIAEVFEVSTSAVKMRTARLKKRLQQQGEYS